MALKFSACQRVVVLAVVLALTTMGQRAAAQECGACSQKCVDDCRTPASRNCESLCRAIPQLCDTCDAVLVWKRCAASCYLENCLTGPGSAMQCPPLFTACSACDQTCDSPCDDLDQALCAGDCLLPTGLPTGDPSSPECAACKARAARSCAEACRAIVCGIILSCPPV